MARPIKISTVGAATPKAGPQWTAREQMDRVMDFWDDRLAQVWPDRPDLVVVPEMCDAPGDLTPAQLKDLFRQRGDRGLAWFQETARRHECYLTYPTLREMPDGSWRNSVYLLDRSGGVAGIYDKNYVVFDETTQGGVLCGAQAPVIECDFGRVACAVCFDLNFDDLRLRYYEQSPDLILFPSMFHGGFLQKYWAYSCRAHFVSAVSIANLTSGIISPVGHAIATTTNYFDFVTATVNLDCVVVHLGYNEEKLRKLKRKYAEQVTIFDPGELGAVLVSSEARDITAQEMARDFDIELLDSYFERSLQHHDAHRASI